MRFFGFLLAVAFAGPAWSDSRAVERVAMSSFGDMPEVLRLDAVNDVCGSHLMTDTDVIYCTSENRIYLRSGSDHAAYKLAHAMGHAVQVRHGIADIALREIRARRSEEAELRAMVTRQVECIAGFLMAKAREPEIDLTAAFTREPFTGSHWGRNPVRVGPKVSIGTAARAEWLAIGYSADSLAACAVGEMGAELLLEAYKG